MAKIFCKLPGVLRNYTLVSRKTQRSGILVRGVNDGGRGVKSWIFVSVAMFVTKRQVSFRVALKKKKNKKKHCHIRFKVVSFYRGQIKLQLRPNWSPLGDCFKVSDLQPPPFHMGSLPVFFFSCPTPFVLACFPSSLAHSPYPELRFRQIQDKIGLRTD